MKATNCQVCVFILVQAVYAIYTLTLNKTNAAKIINVIVRFVVSGVLATTLYYTLNLTITETFCVIYITNFVITLFYALLHVKQTYIFAIGVLMYIICDVIVGITFGGADIFNFTGPIIDFLYMHDVAYWFYIPAVYTIAMYSAIKRRGGRK